jgi:integrase/recombinase XerC
LRRRCRCPPNAAWLEAFALQLAARPRHTREAYWRDTAVLAQQAGATDLARLTAPELRRFVALLHGRGLAGRSLARMLSSWRAFYRFAQDRDAGIAESPCSGLRPPRSPKKLPSALSPDEAVRLVAIDGSADPLALRDRALFELAYSSGLRLSELAGVDVDRLDLDSGEVRVWGKGAKERIVPVGAAALDAIRAWLAVRAALPSSTRACSSATAVAGSGADDRAAAGGAGGEARAAAPRPPAHAAALVRLAPAAVLRRLARRG